MSYTDPVIVYTIILNCNVNKDRQKYLPDETNDRQMKAKELIYDQSNTTPLAILPIMFENAIMEIE